MKLIVGMPWRLDWNFSGLAKRVKACFNSISDLGIEVDLICLGPKTRKERFSVSRIKVNTTHHKDPFSSLINSLAFSHEFAKRVIKEKNAIIQCFNTTSLFLGGKNYLFETANPTYSFALEAVKDEYPKTAKYHRFLNYYSTVAELEKLEYEGARTIIANSEIVKNNIRQCYDVEKERITVIPNGVLPEECNFDRSFNELSGMKIVIFPSSIHVMKGFRYLVEAMVNVRKEFPDTVLFVCGRIHPFEYDIFEPLIKRMRKKSGLVLLGFLPREKLFKYFHLADVCCIPLIFGTMSNAILEAVAHGLPIVTTKHSGFPEIDKVGIKVPPKDSKTIADAIIGLLSDQELRRKKSDSARKVIEKYYWNNLAEEFKDIYKKMLN